MENPYTGEDVSRRAAKHITDLRTVRRNARKAARSGHPGRRAEGRRVLAQIGRSINAVYRMDAQRRLQGLAS